jgi:hypothetical protein
MVGLTSSLCTSFTLRTSFPIFLSLPHTGYSVYIQTPLYLRFYDKRGMLSNFMVCCFLLLAKSSVYLRERLQENSRIVKCPPDDANAR